MTAIETMPRCGALIDIENVKTSLRVMIMFTQTSRGTQACSQVKSQISETRCTVGSSCGVRCCSDGPKSFATLLPSDVSTQPTASKCSTRCLRLRWPSTGRMERTRRPDSVHTVLVAALMVRDITEKFEFTTEAALVPFNMQELRCCRTWKVYVTGTRRTTHRRRSYRVLNATKAMFDTKVAGSDRSLAVSRRTRSSTASKVIGVDVIFVVEHHSNIHARPRRYHRVNDGRKRNSLIE
jgi:hypothetical protein